MEASILANLDLCVVLRGGSKSDLEGPFHG
jgi:hypothetical protein